MNDSLENQLLHAALLCGMVPNGKPAYRLQLFFVANRELGSKSHQSDFQRALETAVDSKGLWENFDYKGSGEYLITELGYRTARVAFGEVKPKYQPAGLTNLNVKQLGISINCKLKSEQLEKILRYLLTAKNAVQPRKHTESLKTRLIFIFQQPGILL